MEQQSLWIRFSNLENVKIISDFTAKQFLPTLIFWLYLAAALLLIDLTGGQLFSNGTLAGVDLVKKLSAVLFDKNIFIAIFLAMLLLLVIAVVIIAIFKNVKWMKLPSLETYFLEGVSQLNSFSAIFIVSGIGGYIRSTHVDWELIRLGAYIGLAALSIQWVLRRFFMLISEQVLPGKATATPLD